MNDNEGILALFAYADDFLSALRSLKTGNHRIETVFSPLRLPEVHEILGAKPSAVRLFTLLGGIFGGLVTVALAVYAHLSYHLITGGKPILPWTPWVIVGFEGTILGAVIFSVLAWILKGGLPRLRPVAGYDPRFSQDRFGILVACTGTEEENIKTLLTEAGAGEVRHVAW
jgi:hypothetical protein